MIVVQTVPPSRRRFALELLFEDRPPPERKHCIDEILSATETGALSLERLMLAEENAMPLGVGLLAMQSDGVGFVWPPVVRSPFQNDRGKEIADALLGGYRDELDSAGAWLGQAIVEPTEDADRAALVRNGFEHLTDLVFLSRPVSANDPSPNRVACGAWDFVTAAELRAAGQSDAAEPGDATERRFATLLEATYHESLDCPILNGYRSGSQAVRSHELTGTYRPEWWTIFHREERDEGLLILADHPENNSVEVAYIGVAPEARRSGLGSRMLLHAESLAEANGREEITLAVDDRNSYALALYRRHHFQPIARRSVHGRLSER